MCLTQGVLSFQHKKSLLELPKLEKSNINLIKIIRRAMITLIHEDILLVAKLLYNSKCPFVRLKREGGTSR